MLLKNRVAIYLISKTRVLSYDEVVQAINFKCELFLKYLDEDRQVHFVELPNGVHFRDIEMFAKGMEVCNNKIVIERRTYTL